MIRRDPPPQQASQPAPERPLPDLSDPFRTNVVITIDLNNTLLHNVKDGGASRPVIPYSHLQPVLDLLASNADLEIVSFVGFKEYCDMTVEGGLCDRSSRVVRNWIAQHRVPTQPSQQQHHLGMRRGAYRGLHWVNRKLGAPGFERHNNMEDTGGKDWRCRITQSPVIVDDHAGTCAGCADCGITPVIVASRKHPQKGEGIPSFDGFPAAIRHVVGMLRNRDQRATLITQASRIMVPRPRARERFDFADISNAPRHITAADFQPKQDDAGPLAPTNDQQR